MGAFGPDAKQLLLEGISSDYWTSVVSSVVCLAVLVHSTALHRKAWKRPRIHTESCAVCTFLGGTTLLLGYPMEEGFWKGFLIDSFSMSLCFGGVQFVDNLQLLECVEMAGGKIKKPAVRYAVKTMVFLIMFAWFPVYFLRAWSSMSTFFDEDPNGIFLTGLALWYYIPAFFIYNGLLEIYFLQRVCRFNSVKSTQQGKLYILAFKSLLRTLTSTLGIVGQVMLEPYGMEITGSLIYMTAITVSSHVIFNTQIMSDQVLSSLFFRNIVFVAEDAAKMLNNAAEMMSRRSVAMSMGSPTGGRRISSQMGNESITSRDGVERYGNTDRRPSAAGEPSFTITPRGGRGSFADTPKGGTTPPGSARTGWDSQKGVVGGARTSRDSQVGLPGTVRTGRDTQMGLPLTVRTSRDGQVGLPGTVGTSRDSHVGLPGVEAAGGRTDAVVVIQVASPLMPASDLAGADDVIPLEEVLAP